MYFRKEVLSVRCILESSGGVGSAVAEVLMDEGCGNIPFRRTAFQDVNVTKVGSQIWLRDQYGLGVCDIVNAVKSIGKRG